MDRKTYIDTVLSALRHVTSDERLAIRAEIDGHIEDHMEGLLELGYSPELAEERTLDAMGDPKEVGRELNKQYTGWGFVLLSRVPIGSDVVRVYGVSRLTREGVPAVGVFVCAYDHLPGGVVSDRLLPGMWIEDPRGEALEWLSGGSGHGSIGADYQLRYVPVEETDTSITLRYERFGENIAVEIPLPEVAP